MNYEEIVRLAREAGLSVQHIAEPPEPYDHVAGHGDKLAIFAAKVFARGVARGAWEATGPVAEAADQYRLEGWRVAQASAAFVASEACLVPPDGGAPTKEEADLCDAAADAIRAMQPPREWGGATAAPTQAEIDLLLTSCPTCHRIYARSRDRCPTCGDM